ncbi:hypothetical protein [Schlesneria sp. T3-172]|uniref:hypothetical protein n=1 Tax=Schlesneria sphaerica TaxID=3373610 RepID=UPI0037C92498
MTKTTPWTHLPPLAGLCSFADAQRSGLSVEECVTWMKRHHYLLVRLHQIFTARITAEPVYELKTAFSLHTYLCAEHATAIRQRVSELRDPPLGLEVVPHPALELLCDEVLAAPTHTELVLGIYDVIVPALLESLQQYISTTNPLSDSPSVRIARFCILEMEDLLTFGRQAVNCLVDAESARKRESWRSLLMDCLAHAGGVSGRDACVLKSKTDVAAAAEDGDEVHSLVPQFSAVPYEYDPIPKRDARFQDSFNGGVNPEAFLYDERFSARDKSLMMFYKRLREIDVPEMMASILVQTPGKPWKYYRDMTRQLWDEARHAMLGEVGFVHLGIDWSQIPINFTWSRNLNTQLKPWERHAVLFFIEQGLMPRTGKRYEWEVGLASGVPLAGLFQDFDWADEVLHAQIGREWYVKEFGNLNEAMSYGDRCWSQVLSHWRNYLDEGLTQHRNWWPVIYRAACEHWGVTPDPDALAFNTTYETTRADLQEIH